MTGKALKKLRFSLGLSGRRAAEILGVHTRTVLRWEAMELLPKKLAYVGSALRSAVE